jgi:hypothetical protein
MTRNHRDALRRFFEIAEGQEGFTSSKTRLPARFDHNADASLRRGTRMRRIQV